MQDLQHTERWYALLAAAKIASTDDPRARLRAIARFRGIPLTRVAVLSGVDYVRLETVLNLRHRARPGELEAISRVLLADEP